MTTARVFMQFKVFFRDFDIGSERTQKIIAITLAIIMTILVAVTFAWRVVAALPADEVATRNYLYMPFDIYDAELICEEKMQVQLGARLLRSHVDQHSTRLDEKKGIYRIYFKADVGHGDLYEQVDVYCYVDKWDHDMKYYREVNPSAKSAIYSDIKFF